jgi:hypothetical protein
MPLSVVVAEPELEPGAPLSPGRDAQRQANADLRQAKGPIRR